MNGGAKRDCFIGIDLGTSGCRAVAIDVAGTTLAQAQAKLPPTRHSEGGVSEQEPELWWQAVRYVLSGLIPELGRNPIAGIAVDGTSSTLLAATREGVPLGPALMYDDSRAKGFVARIKAEAPPGSIVASAGSSLAKSLYLVSRLQQDDIGHLLHQADWILGKLSGRFGVSDENNALKLGYDPVALHWPDWVFRLSLSAAWLPNVYRPGTEIAPLSPSTARQLGLSPRIPVFAGTTDSTAAVLATGIATPGQAVSCLGTTLVLKILSTTPVFAPKYGVYSQRLGDLWLVGGASNSGGAVLERFFSGERIERLSAQVDPDRPSGLDYYPLCRPGERFPVNDPAYPPRLTPRPDDETSFLQAMLEGIAAIERDGYLQLQKLGAPAPIQVTTIGGGARNPAWRRIRERILGLPVVIAAQQQAAYGAALLAASSAATGSH